MEDLKREKTEAQTRADALQGDLDSLKELIARGQGQLETQVQTVALKDTTITDLETRLGQAQRQLGEQELQDVARAQELGSVKQQLETRVTEVTQLQEQLGQAAAAHKKEMTDLVDDGRARIEGLRVQLQIVEEERNRLLVEVERQKLDLTTFTNTESALKEKTDMCDKADTKLQAALGLIRELQDQVADLEAGQSDLPRKRKVPNPPEGSPSAGSSSTADVDPQGIINVSPDQQSEIQDVVKELDEFLLEDVVMDNPLESEITDAVRKVVEDSKREPRLNVEKLAVEEIDPGTEAVMNRLKINGLITEVTGLINTLPDDRQPTERGKLDAVSEWYDASVQPLLVTFEKCKMILKYRFMKDFRTEFATRASDLLNSQEYMNLNNLKEDLGGDRRVYVRVKPQGTNMDTGDVLDVNGQRIKVTCGKDPEESFGDFYSIYPETAGNLDVFNGGQNTPAMRDVLYQVASGYNVVLFGYGSSGSGKTSTLLGDTGTGVKGVVPLILADLMQNGAVVELTDVFELSAKHDVLDPLNQVIPGQILVWPVNGIERTDKMPQLFVNKYFRTMPSISALILRSRSIVGVKQGSILDEAKTLNAATGEQWDVSLSDLLKKLDVVRKQHHRITETPFNPRSSRSHLFMTFEVTFKDKTGRLTVIDMAGRENPQEIGQIYYGSQEMNKILATPEPLPGVAGSDRAPEIYKEGFYINETLNHVKYFFQNLNAEVEEEEVEVIKNITRGPYDPEKFMKSPREERTDKLLDTIKKGKGSVMMLPILEALKGPDPKMSKFIMVATIDSAQCADAKKTLKFAESMKKVRKEPFSDEPVHGTYPAKYLDFYTNTATFQEVGFIDVHGPVPIEDDVSAPYRDYMKCGVLPRFNDFACRRAEIERLYDSLSDGGPGHERSALLVCGVALYVADPYYRLIDSLPCSSLRDVRKVFASRTFPISVTQIVEDIDWVIFNDAFEARKACVDFLSVSGRLSRDGCMGMRFIEDLVQHMSILSGKDYMVESRIAVVGFMLRFIALSIACMRAS